MPSTAKFLRTKSRPIILPAFLAIISVAGLFPLRVFAQTANGEDPLLARVTAGVEQFFEQFAFLRYEEDVSQQKLKPNGGIQYKQDTIYDSIWRLNFDDGKPRVDEQRILEKMPRHVESRPLIQAYGFSSLAMIFHSYYSSSFRFTRIEDDSINGKQVARYHLIHLPGTPSPILYQMINVDRPMEITGTAWVDPATAAVYRIAIDIGSSMSDMGVKGLSAELTYGGIPLRDEKELQWLPVSVTIDLETPRQHWRNTIHYTDFRKYRVESKIAIPEAKQ